MKLQNNKKKRIIIAVVIAVVLLLVIAVGIAVASFLNSPYGDVIKQPETNESGETGIVMASFPKQQYYIGEEFDSTGAKIQVLTETNASTYFVDYTDNGLTFSGFDSSTPGEKVITVSYKGFTTTYTVVINQYQGNNPEITKIEVCGMRTTYSLKNWNSSGPSDLNTYLVFTYSDGSTYGSLAETPVSRSDMYGYTKMDAPGTTEITVKYIVDGVEYSATVTITITE